VNFGSGTKDCNLAFVNDLAAVEEGEHRLTEVAFVVVDESLKCCVDIVDFFLDLMGDVFVDCCVAEMFGQDLLDINIALPNGDSHVFVCFNNHKLIMILETAEGMNLQCSGVPIDLCFGELVLLDSDVLCEVIKGSFNFF
jgi:hypothetical protein